MAFRVKLVFAFVAGWAATAAGQRVITLNPLQLTGSIVQIGQNAIAVKAANGQNWTLKLQGNTKIKVTGSAEPEMLKPDTCVRFTARIDKRTCKSQDKIDKITIFTETPGVAERTLGVERASDLPQANQDQAGAAGLPLGPSAGPAIRPGRDPGIVEEGAAGAKPPKRRGPASKGPDKSVPDVADYDICAQVVSYHGRRLVVSVQNRFFKPKITAELSADVQIGLDLGDLSMAKPGDKISAAGYYVTPGVCQMVDTVEVTLANPLAPPGSRPHRAHPPAHGSDAARRPDEKAKPGPEAAAKKNTPAPAPATTKKAKPETKPAPPPADEITLPAEETKPEPKKPPVKDDEKDVFE